LSRDGAVFASFATRHRGMSGWERLGGLVHEKRESCFFRQGESVFRCCFFSCSRSTIGRAGFEGNETSLELLGRVRGRSGREPVNRVRVEGEKLDRKNRQSRNRGSGESRNRGIEESGNRGIGERRRAGSGKSRNPGIGEEIDRSRGEKEDSGSRCSGDRRSGGIGKDGEP
jgi:hypothetical protein